MQRQQDTRSADQIRALSYPALQAVLMGVTGAGRTTRLVAMAELDRREAAGRETPMFQERPARLVVA